MLKTLDIFVPFWGDPALLRKTVHSVVAQEDQDWRLTVIDDAYPDDSVPTFFDGLEDERISYVRNEKNVGITENFREAVRRAASSHLTVLGSDDLLHPNYVGLIKKVITRVPDADVIQPGVEVIDENGVVVSPLVDRVKQRLLAPHGQELTVLRGEQMATSLMRGNWLYWPSLAFRTKTMRQIDFRDGFPIILDLALLMDIAFADGCLAYDPEVAFSYRRHSSSLSQTSLLDGTRFRGEREYFALARALAGEKGWSGTRRAARLRVMSRLHALTELPGVLRRGSRAGKSSAFTHVFGN